MSKRGIDVSQWQGTIDWNAVKASGIEFAMIRAGFGNNNIDKQFARNIAECNRVGIPCGVYWFSYAYTVEMAIREAMQVLAAIKPYVVEYPVCFDFEYDSVRYAGTKGVTMNKKLATDMVKAFCKTIEDAGYYAMNYSNLDYANNMFDMEALKNYDLWYARYIATCDRRTGIWQYSNQGSVPGITGNVDMDYANNDYPAIMRSVGLNGFSKTTPAPVPPAPVPDPIKEESNTTPPPAPVEELSKIDTPPAEDEPKAETVPDPIPVPKKSFLEEWKKETIAPVIVVIAIVLHQLGIDVDIATQTNLTDAIYAFGAAAAIIVTTVINFRKK